MENYIDGIMTIADYNEEETCYVLDTNYFFTWNGIGARDRCVF